MNKKLFFAALAAMTLSLGFTACDDDDDEVTSSYDETYVVRIASRNEESTEYAAILNAYYSGLGITDTLTSTVTVSGKNKADCDTIFKQMVGKINETLYSKTWEDTTYVNGWRKEGYEHLFKIVFQPVANDLYIDTDSLYVSEVYDVKHTHSTGNWYGAGWMEVTESHFLRYLGTNYMAVLPNMTEFLAFMDNKDGNYGNANISAWGPGPSLNIWVLTRQSQTPETLVKDVIAVEFSNGDAPLSLKFEGRTYKRYQDVEGDLNFKINGAPLIYLYSTYDDVDGSAICSVGVKLFCSYWKYSQHWMQVKSFLWWSWLGNAYDKFYERELTEFPEEAYAKCKQDLESRGMTPHVLQLYTYNASTQQLTLQGPCNLNKGVEGRNFHLCWGTKKIN